MTLFARELIANLRSYQDIRVSDGQSPDDQYIEVRHESGALSSVSPITCREAITIVDAGMASGEVNKHGRLKYLRLIVSVRAVQRLIARTPRSGKIASAEDNKTTILDGATYFHHKARSAAYNRIAFRSLQGVTP